MTKEYLAYVIVYNMTSEDYEKGMDAAIEKAVISAISSIDQSWGANENNMIFSFPQDPSVKSGEIPVMVEVSLLSLGRGNSIHYNKQVMANKIRDYLLALFGERRGDVVVNIRGWEQSVCSPRV